jgi:hypothetical protein
VFDSASIDVVPHQHAAVVMGCVRMLPNGLNNLSFTKSKPQKTLEDLDDDDGGIDWRETGAKDVVVETRDGWVVLMDNVPVHEAKAARKWSRGSLSVGCAGRAAASIP